MPKGGRIYNLLEDREREMRYQNPWYLESYHYIKGAAAVEKMRAEGVQIFLDSGAYSAYTQGVQIDIYEYCDYIHKNADFIAMASVLDAIGDPDGTWQNQWRMEQLGVNPLPCYHYNEPTAVLDHYVKNYDYITIGGMVPISTQQLTLWLDRIWNEHLINGDGTPKVKVHGFGLTSLPLMLRYPWHCLTDDHEILTRHGWSQHRALKVGEEVLAFRDGVARWEPIEEIPTYRVKDIEIRAFDYRSFSARVTPNHRWRVWDQTRSAWRFVETDQLTHRRSLRIPRVPDDYEGPDETIPDPLVDLMGWFWTRGKVENGAIMIVFSPPSAARGDEFQTLLDNNDLMYSKHVNKDGRRGMPETVFRMKGPTYQFLHTHAPKGRLSVKFVFALSKRQLEMFIRASFASRGTRTHLQRGFGFRITQRLKLNGFVNIETFRVACLLAGYPTSAEMGRLAVQSGSVRWIHPESDYCKHHSEYYTGTLWCVKVRSGAFFTRCNDRIYVTGNSIDSSTWVQWAANGMILLPRKKAYQIDISELSPRRKIKDQHLDTLNPIAHANIDAWIRGQGVNPDRLRKLYYVRWAWNTWAFPEYVRAHNNGAEIFQTVDQELPLVEC